MMSKVQIGYAPIHIRREMGDVWIDINGIKWEQKDGYRIRVSKLPLKGIAEKCSDCDKLIIKSRDKNTFYRMGRCFICQIDFENELKKKGMWKGWVIEQEKLRYKSVLREFKSFVEETTDTKAFDYVIDKALANENIERSIEENK